MERVTGVASLSLAVEDFRVPLDLPREGVCRLPWAPLSINDHTVGDQRNLLQVLTWCRTVVDHARPPVPLLVDENIDYRVRKMCYSATWLHWDMRAYIRDLPPPLCGI